MAITAVIPYEMPVPSAAIADPTVFLINAGAIQRGGTSGTAGDPLTDQTTNPNAFLNGGGSLSVYSDSALTQRLPVYIERFVTGVSPDVFVWSKLDSIVGGEIVYIAHDPSQVSQPSVSDPFGRNETFQDYVYATLDGRTDLTGNNTINVMGSPATGVAPWGGDSISLNGSTQYGRTDVALDRLRPMTYTAWAKASSTAQAGIFGCYFSTEAFSLDCLRIDNSQKFQLWTRNGTNTGAISTDSVSLVAWQRVTGKAISTSERAILINGTNKVTDTTANGAVSGVFDRLTYGRYDDSTPGNYFTGELAGMFLSYDEKSDQEDLTQSENQTDPTNWPASVGAYDLVSSAGYELDLDTGLLSLSGSDLDLIKSSVVSIDAGALSLTGQDLTLEYSPLTGYEITLDTGSLSLTGSDLTLSRTYVLPIDSGQITLTSSDLELIYTVPGSYEIELDSGVISLAGSDLEMTLGRSIYLESGVLTLNGSDVELIKSSVLELDSGVLALSGTPLTLNYSGLVILTIEDFSLSYTNDTIELNYTTNGISLEYK